MSNTLKLGFSFNFPFSHTTNRAIVFVHCVSLLHRAEAGFAFYFCTAITKL